MQQNYGPASFRHGLRIQQFHIFQCHDGTGPQSNFQRLYMGGNALFQKSLLHPLHNEGRHPPDGDVAYAAQQQRPQQNNHCGNQSLDPSHKCPLSHKPCLLCTGTATRYPKRRDIAPPICVADLFYGSGNNVTRLEQPRVAAGQTFCRRKTAPTPPINYEHYHSPCILPWTCQPRMAGYIPHIQLRQLFQPGTHAIRSSARAQ